MGTEREFIQKLAKIQKELKAPKSQFNKFGGYNYRNQEDILEAVKPLLGDLVLTVSDEMIQLGERFYVKATAVITDGEHELSNSSYARESETKKGMDDSMCTGTASSYARKYSLNGLFLIDDTKDADSDEFQIQTGKDKTEKKADKPSRFQRGRPAKNKSTESSSEEENVEVKEDTTSSEKEAMEHAKLQKEENTVPSSSSFRRFTRNKQNG